MNHVSFRKNTMLVMVGQNELMPGQMPGYARVWLRLCYNIFPKPIGQIIHAYGVQELHLSLTRGRWKTQLWGYPPVFTPSGVEAWAWFLPGFGYDICSNSTCIVVCCNERR